MKIISLKKFKIKISEIKYNIMKINEFLPKNKIIENDELYRNNNVGFILFVDMDIFLLILENSIY